MANNVGRTNGTNPSRIPFGNVTNTSPSKSLQQLGSMGKRSANPMSAGAHGVSSAQPAGKRQALGLSVSVEIPAARSSRATMEGMNPSARREFAELRKQAKALGLSESKFNEMSGATTLDNMAGPRTGIRGLSPVAA